MFRLAVTMAAWYDIATDNNSTGRGDVYLVEPRVYAQA
jgi:hypothetical protein